MTETNTISLDDAVGDEIKPFVDDQNREIAYRSDSNPATAAGESARPAVIAPGAATGRRKEAVARVRIVPGSGNWTINGRTLDDYFPNKVHQQLVTDPFTTAGVAGAYDVIARIDGTADFFGDAQIHGEEISALLDKLRLDTPFTRLTVADLERCDRPALLADTSSPLALLAIDCAAEIAVMLIGLLPTTARTRLAVVCSSLATSAQRITPPAASVAIAA